MACSSKTAEWSLAPDSKADILTFHICLGGSTSGAWRVSPLLGKPSANSCPPGPLSKGTHLFSCQASPMRDQPPACLLQSTLGSSRTLVTDSVSRCFASPLSPGSPAGVQVSRFWKRGVPWTGQAVSMSRLCSGPRASQLCGLEQVALPLGARFPRL